MKERLCKICNSRLRQSIEMAKFYLLWKQDTLMDVFKSEDGSDGIFNLNPYNLATHLGNHCESEAKFWMKLRQKHLDEECYPYSTQS